MSKPNLKITLMLGLLLGVGGVGFLLADTKLGTISYSKATDSLTEVFDVAATSSQATSEQEPAPPAWPLPLNREAYDQRLLALVDFAPPATTTIIVPATATSATSTKEIPPASPLIYSNTSNVTIADKRWPARAPYPHGGALLPFNRILAYYGNFYSTKMGILGELEPEAMLAHLSATQAKWEVADPETPVLPAIQYIAMVAQADAGVDGMYRNVMPDSEIEKGYALAQQINGIYILDLQVGLSTVEREVPKFRDYLMRPDVHLAVDPEFSMKGGQKPGTVIGTFDASDINFIIDYLADIVKEYQLPPKILVVHRFTADMVTGSARIKPRPEVQVVMDMDGWGPKSLKLGTWSHVIEPEPVQFTGIKLFYKNDLKPPSTGLLSPAEVLDLHPKPIYIQYQ